MNVKKICRTCSLENLNMFSIFAALKSAEHTAVLADMLMACSSVHVQTNDGLPDLICLTCIKELQTAYVFKLRSEKTDSTLRQYLNKDYETHLLSSKSYISDSHVTNFKNIKLNNINEVDDKQKIKPLISQNVNSEIPISKIYSCPKCDHIFTDESLLLNHVSICEVIKLEENYELENFENNIKSESSLATDDNKSIIVSVEPNNVIKSFFCHVCNVSFSLLSNLNRHLKKHTAQSSKCEICHKVFSRSDSLAEHLRRHKGIKPHQCEECSKRFVSLSSLKAHKLIHERDNGKMAQEKRHQCSYCQKSFVSNSSLIIHTRTHTKEKPFLCTSCGKKFATQGGLDLHTRRHTGERPYKCEFCGHAFAESSNLRVHIRGHTGDKPHMCSLCGKRFTRMFLLQLHIRTHTGEKPYKCTECPKAFAQQGDLAAHKRTHSGYRPHVCVYCGQGFIKSGGMKKHLQSKHRSEINVIKTKTEDE